MTCTYDPIPRIEHGMHHCPECGEMVLGGFPHPDYERVLTDEDHAVIQGLACWIGNHSASCQAGDVLDYIDFPLDW